MARALLRLRPDGIYEIVSQRRARRLTSAAAALVVACAVGLALAAALSAFVSTARAFEGGAVLAAAGLLGLAIRLRIGAAARPLASTILLRPASARVPRTGGARDAGA